MASNEVLGIEIVAMLDRFKTDMAAIPGIGAKEAKALAGQLSKEIRAAERAAKSAGTSHKAMAREVGVAATAVSRLASSLGLSGENTGFLIRGLGGVSTGAGLAAAGVAGAALAVGALGAGMVAATLRADDALKKLEGFKAFDDGIIPEISPAALASIEAANVAFDALKSELQAMILALGAEFAPTVERAGYVVVGMADAVVDLIPAMSDGLDVAIRWGRGIAHASLYALAPVEDLAKGLLALQDLVGIEVPASVRSAVEGLADLRNVALDAAGTALSTAADYYGLSDGLAAVASRGREVVDAQRKVTAANKAAAAGSKEAAKAAKDQAAAEKEAAQVAEEKAESLAKVLGTIRADEATELQALEDRYREYLTTVETAYKGDRDAAERAAIDKAAVDEWYTAERERLLAEQAATVAAYRAKAAKDLAADLEAQQKELDDFRDAVLGAVVDVSDAVGMVAGTMADKLAEEGKEGANTAFRVEQAAALTSIAINTARAIMAAYALGPIAGSVAAAGVTALGVAQAAIVLSEEPPVAHAGMIVDGAPDERLIRAQTGEAVLSRQGVAAAGGGDAVRALNRGGGGGMQTIVVNQVYRHRYFDTYIQGAIDRTNSPLARAITPRQTKKPNPFLSTA